MKRKQLGTYIVADPKICHGKPTFAGTRIMVAQVIHLVARGRSWKWIAGQFDNKINREGIAEALELASRIFVEHEHDFAQAYNGER